MMEEQKKEETLNLQEKKSIIKSMMTFTKEEKTTLLRIFVFMIAILTFAMMTAVKKSV